MKFDEVLDRFIPARPKRAAPLRATASILWPKRRRPVDYLDLCGMRCIAKGPAPLHGTLAPRPSPRHTPDADEGDAGAC